MTIEEQRKLRKLQWKGPIIPKVQVHQEKLGEVLCSRVKQTCYCIDYLQLSVTKSHRRKVTKVRRLYTIRKGFRRI
ncbi:hypothetical protein, partial [Actinobacillus pleuropneumoniae]|uniref:hypothetical protein n=1 Tax=Actinobacillus pleuropneumoniae TaxID=715 RepID=UPI00227CFB3B